MAGFIPFAARPEWADVVPVPQQDPPDAVVPIDYPADFREVMDYFRAILLKDERSPRALALTEEVIECNASNYTAWYFRRRCLEALNSDLYAELDYIQQVADDNPKNYQIWYHRRAIVERLGDPSKELDFVAGILKEDAKNYHAWSHRQWVLKTYNLWEGELEYIDCTYTPALLESDLRNNSAWNQRWFVVHNAGQPVTDEVVRREIAYAFAYIDKAVLNESPWNYLRGYFKSRPYIDLPEVKAKCLELTVEWMTHVLRDWMGQKEERGQKCPYVAAALMNIYEQEGTETSLQEAAQLAEQLGSELDEIRRKYWHGVALDRINKKLLAMPASS